MLEDKKIICRDCKKEFILLKGEQKFYEDKGLALPVRCKECRNLRKQQNETEKTENKPQKKEDKKDFFEEMLAKFQAQTVLFEEERERREKKKRK